MSEIVYFWTVSCLSVAWIATSTGLVLAVRFFQVRLSETQDRVFELEKEGIRRREMERDEIRRRRGGQ